jgi:hypothetical protein
MLTPVTFSMAMLFSRKTFWTQAAIVSPFFDSGKTLKAISSDTSTRLFPASPFGSVTIDAEMHEEWLAGFTVTAGDAAAQR